MKSIFKILSLTIVNVILSGSNIYARPLSTIIDTTIKAGPGLQEQFVLFTDRTFYAAGENCLFAAFRTGENRNQLSTWSKTLYVELLKPDGMPVLQTKFPVTENAVGGNIEIPGNLLTGYYYLRAYTRWMRNFGEENFPVIRLQIFNPKETALQASVLATNTDTKPVTGNGLVVKKDIISVKADNANPGTRQKVNLTIGINKKAYGLPDNYCITVIRPGLTDSVNYGLLPCPTRRPANAYPLRYIPDMRGLSLSGSIVEKATGTGVANLQMMLSVFGGFSDFYSYVTRPDGGFVFDLKPFNGETEMYITLAPGLDENYEIRVDEEYAGNGHLNNLQPFSLSAIDKKTAQEIVFNSQVKMAYRNPTKEDTLNSNHQKAGYFYGKPANIIYIDQYIDLPTIEEVLFELVHEIAVVKRKDAFYFKTNGFYTDIEIFKPLILIDNIPIDDFESFLKTSPDKLERIDIIDRIYAKGDYLYGGVLNFISRKKDFGGITLPENAYFFNYDGYQQSACEPVPVADDNTEKEDRIPDFRNCLYWNPSAVVKVDNTSEFSFKTSDLKGDFKVLVRGVTADGTILEGSCTIKVK
ncbi:MAG: hypothetical protein JXB00_04935 [Bacteroidales bacterium]|nr:hypothetical protein [Bacteroidales bacterium]